MRIKQIQARKLFGFFNHIIPLKMEDRLTIIHGPNGFGKTIVLKMLNGLFNSQFAVFRSIPFGEFSVTFEDGGTVVVSAGDKKPNSKEKRRKHRSLVFDLLRDGKKVFSYQLDQDLGRGFPLSAIDDILPFLERVGPERWQDRRTPSILSLSDVIEKYGEMLPFSQKLPQDRPDWFVELQNSLDVRFIDTERLRSAQDSRYRKMERGYETPELTVIRYASELAWMIKSKLAESAELTQSLDRSFPARLVKHGSLSEMSDEAIREKLTNLEAKRSRLERTGLIDKEDDMNFQIAPASLDQTTKHVLAVYADDTERKLSIFDDIANKISLFETLVNKRFHPYKRISISKQDGFLFSSIDATPLAPSDLSSGEQHEIVLMYELLFKVTQDSLVLIDEPEISLHVAWQQEFLRDLHDITLVSPFDVVIATHSPQIIHDRWDLTVELRGPDATSFNSVAR